MRPNLFVTVTVTTIVLASTAAAYYLLRGNALPRPVEAVQPASSSTADLTVTAPLREAHRDHSADSERRQLALMREKITALEARLRTVEATANEQARNLADARADKPVTNEEVEKAKVKKLSEEDFGQWLDEMLHAGDFDHEATQLTMQEMATSLAEAPGLNLADLQCGQRFCRASFIPDNGVRPNIAQLMGASPFIAAGFTLTEPDGGVRFYFTQPGQSFGELRSEAQESALRDLSPQ